MRILYNIFFRCSVIELISYGKKSMTMTDLSIWIEDVLLREELCQIKRFDGILFLKKNKCVAEKTKLENADLYYVKWFKEIHKATIVNNINARFHEKKLIFGQLLTILQCSSIDYMIPKLKSSEVLTKKLIPCVHMMLLSFFSVVSREQFRFRFEITLIASF